MDCPGDTGIAGEKRVRGTVTDGEDNIASIYWTTGHDTSKLNENEECGEVRDAEWKADQVRSSGTAATAVTNATRGDWSRKVFMVPGINFRDGSRFY